MKEILAVFGVLAASFYPLPADSDVLTFACSWEGKSGIEITIDTIELTAVRDDGGARYRVLNITDEAIFLHLKIPNSYRVGVQVLERPSGGWHDIIIYDDGKVSAIEDGVCIERK
jgi:hypothetical protein